MSADDCLPSAPESGAICYDDYRWPRRAKLPSWSFTFLSDLANCAHKAYRKHVLKDLPRGPPSEPQRRGLDAHAKFEKYLKGEADDLPDSWRTLAEPLRRLKAQSEAKLGVKESGEPCSFWDKEVWGRGAVDALAMRDATALLVDWKTGKVREDPRELKIHALLVKAHYPHIHYFKGSYAWLAEDRLGTLHDLSDTTRTENAVRASMRLAAEYESVGKWPKQQNPLCGWCPVKDCEHNTSV